VLRMEDSRTARRAIQRELRGYKRKPGWLSRKWMYILRRDLEDMDTKELATDRAEWRQRVAEAQIYI